MDSVISLGQNNTLAKYMILSGADNRPPMLDKDLYDSWKSQMELYIDQNKKYAELSTAKKIQAYCDMKATNIILQGLPTDIYSLVNHHRVAKDLWERVQLLMQGTSLTKQERECFSIPVFSLGDDPIVCLNKAMAFLTAVASSRFPQPLINLELHRIQETRPLFKMAGSQCNKFRGDKVKVILVLCEGHMARQCTQPKRPRNATWYMEKAMLAEAQEVGQILDEEQLAFLTDPGVPKAVLMANISNYGSDVISEGPHSETYLNDMVNQGVQAMQDFEQPPVVDFTDNEIHSDSNIIICREKKIDSQMDDMIREKLALKEQVDSLEQNLSKQIKEKECLLQTFKDFKSESKEKEDKYMENKIDLEKKIKQLDNILFKVGQSAQTVHMLTKPQALYDNIHKQALGYQNPFHLKKAQQIKPILYDGIVMSDKHVDMPVIDDEETLILEKESRSKMSEKAKDPEVINKYISHKPIDYEKLNRLTKDFRKHFTPQQELSAEQAFWLRMSFPTSKPFDALSVKIEAPKELPKLSLVNESLKKLKFHLAKFDNVVKIRTTRNACTEGEWGFGHTKAVFNNEIIPFLKSLKDIFNVFDRDLLNEIMEVKTVFDQIDAEVQQSSITPCVFKSLMTSINLLFIFSVVCVCF
ncbi:hypothetical protein Tco_1362236 [Tanacetum coccineum]